MRKLYSLLFISLTLLVTMLSTVHAVTYKAKYSTNYMMPAYIDFTIADDKYVIESAINIPFYNIAYYATGNISSKNLSMDSYLETRNNKSYAITEISKNIVTYGKIKSNDIKQQKAIVPIYDFFSLAFDVVLFEGKLPKKFIVTNGKKLYKIDIPKITKTVEQVKYKQQLVTQVTYSIQVDDKYITVKSLEGLKVPYYIMFDKDGDQYKLSLKKLDITD